MCKMKGVAQHNGAEYLWLAGWLDDDRQTLFRPTFLGMDRTNYKICEMRRRIGTWQNEYAKNDNFNVTCASCTRKFFRHYDDGLLPFNPGHHRRLKNLKSEDYQRMGSFFGRMTSRLWAFKFLKVRKRLLVVPKRRTGNQAG